MQIDYRAVKFKFNIPTLYVSKHQKLPKLSPSDISWDSVIIFMFSTRSGKRAK